MKKSRIIIPALALIAFSVAASVTGAVAWFTASRTARIDAGTYAVVKTSANLDVELTQGAHTSVNSGSKVVTFGGLLTDGSFDHVNKLIYTPAADGKSLKVDEHDDPVTVSTAGTTFTDEGNLLLRGHRNADTSVTPEVTAADIYTAATFDITFTVSFGAIAGDVGLYLDNTAGKTNFAVEGGAAAKTAKGFRMAFVPIGDNASSGYTRVLADLQDATEEYDNSGTPATRPVIKYIGTNTPKDSFAAKGTAYGEGVVIDKNYASALPSSSIERSVAIGRPDCLGVFAFNSGNQVQLSYRVVCWFEGTDPEIVNRDVLADYQAVIATLHFEAIDLAAATTNP